MTTHLSPDALAELQRLLEAATSGPWRTGVGDSATEVRSVPEKMRVAEATSFWDGGGPNAKLIAALRNAAPALIAELVELRGRVAAEILEPTPAEALGVINYRLPGGFMQTSGGKELKGWSTDPMAGGTVKHYLDSEDCKALATAFLALGHALESHAPDCIAAPERDARKDGG